MAEKDMIIQRKNADGSYTIYYPKTKAKNVTFEDGTTVESHYNENATQHGDLSTLKTTEKSSLVGAINELFTSASDGKTKIGRAITGVDSNIAIPTDPTFQELADAIGQIEMPFDTLVPGDSVVLAGLTYDLKTNWDSTYVKVRDGWVIKKPGIVRVVFNLYSLYSGHRVYGRIYVNDVAVGRERSTDFSDTLKQVYTEDIPVNAGDVIQLYLKGADVSNARSDIFYITVGLPTMNKLITIGN